MSSPLASTVRGAIEFDSIRIYFGDELHIDIRRSTYRGLQTWKWPGHYAIEFALDGATLKVEYTHEERWKAVRDALMGLPLNGE